MKKDLISKVEMNFDEASELFSNETLESMVMMGLLGGANFTNGNSAQCNCTETNCDEAKCGCSEPTTSTSTPTPAATKYAICIEIDLEIGDGVHVPTGSISQCGCKK